MYMYMYIYMLLRKNYVCVYMYMYVNTHTQGPSNIICYIYNVHYNVSAYIRLTYTWFQ